MATEKEKREAAAARAALLRKLDGAVTEGAVARARRATQALKKGTTKKESEMSVISEALAESRTKASSQRAVKANTVSTPSANTDFLRSPVKKSRVEQINEIAEVRGRAEVAIVQKAGGKAPTDARNDIFDFFRRRMPFGGQR